MKHKTILITRPREQSEELRREIEARGGEVVFFPTIAILPPDSWEHLDRALDRCALYDGVIFSSVNGVEKFFVRCRERRMDHSEFSRWEVLAVGRKTAEAIERHGLRVTYTPEEFSAAALAGHLASRDVRGRRFLFPRGDAGREEIVSTLAARGAAVETVTVYRTVAPDMPDAENVLGRIFREEIDVVTFASPSAVKNFAALAPQGELAALCAHTAIAVIGPSTEEAVCSLGGNAAIKAREATARGLAEAISNYFSENI